MNLEKYLATNGIHQTDFADRIGVSSQYLSSLVNGKKTPNVVLALKIEDLTLGVVTCRSWEPKQ